MEALREGDPRYVGPYRLLGLLGVGGMGRVYLGESPGGRKVAVKVMRPELTAGPEFRARFKREVAAARRVGGYHTAQLIDADPDAADPWLVTAYIPAPSLDEKVRVDGVLGSGALLGLAAALAEGLAAIHACGLVHRDLKPRNILMAEDGPRIIDFGVARPASTGVTPLTMAGNIVGTPSFMSPEQIDARPAGQASDVFSLGSVLMFAATGRCPFGDQGLAPVSYAILHKEPDLTPVAEPLRTLVRACLAKDPVGRPTPASLLTALARLTRTPGNQVSEPRSLERAEVPRPAPRPRPRPAASAPSRLEPQVPPASDGWSVVTADPGGRWLASADGDGTIAVWDADSGLPVRAWPARSRVDALAAGPDRLLAAATEDGVIRLWDVATASSAGSFLCHAERIEALAFDPSGGWLAAADEDQIRIWDAGGALVTTVLYDANVTALAFGSGAGALAVGGRDGTVRVTEPGRPGAAAVPADTHGPADSGAVLALGWDDAARRWVSVREDAPDGRLLAAAVAAAGTPAEIVATVDAAHEEVRITRGGASPGARCLGGTGKRLWAVTTIRSDEMVVMGGTGGAPHLWDGRSGQRRMRTVAAAGGRGAAITALAVSSDDRLLAAGHERGRVSVYTVAGATLTELWSRSCPDSVSALAFSPDGKHLITTGDAVRQWDVGDGGPGGPLPGGEGWHARAVAWDPAGRWLAAAGTDGAIRVWDGSRLVRTLAGHKGRVYALAFGPAGGTLDGRLITAGSDGTIRTWDLGGGREPECASGLGYRARVLAVPAGVVGAGTVAVGCADGTVRLCSPPDWTDAPVLAGHAHGITSMSFAGERTLVTASRDGTARVWDLAARRTELLLAPGAAGWAAAERLPDGTWRGHGDTEGRIWLAGDLAREPLPPGEEEQAWTAR